MKKIGLILLVFAHVLTPAAMASADPVVVQSAAARLAELLRNHVVVLDREVMTFHYAIMKEEPIITSSAQIADWAGYMADQFSNVDAVSDDMQGVGYYVASDPHSSRTYGGSEPLLFATPIRKGAVILSLFNNRTADTDVITKLKALANEFDCSADGIASPLENIANTTIAFRNSKKELCRAIVIEAYRQLGIEAILYSYESDNFNQSCRYRNDAFNIINRTAIPADRNALFWNGGSFSNKSFARMVSQTFRDAHSEFYSRYAALTSPDNNVMPRSLQNLQTFERAAQSWRKRNLLRCGPPWSIESSGEDELSQLTNGIKTSFASLDVQDAILDWHVAYRQKYERTDYDFSAPQRILQVERSIYLQTSLARDFSQFELWRKANDVYTLWNQKSDVEKDAAAGALLGEPVPSVSVTNFSQAMMDDLHTMYNPKIPQPGLYGAMLKKVGFGPMIILMKLNQAMGFLGGAPLLATEVPVHPEKNEQELVEVNKKAYIAILRKCTAMMQDRSVSLAQVEASFCSVRPAVH